MNSILPSSSGRIRGVVLGIAAIAIALSAVAATRDMIGADLLKARTAALGPCDPDENLFSRDDRPPQGKTVVDAWKERYHTRVSGVIEAHLAELRTGGTCAEGVRSPPTSALESLAEELPGWRSKGNLSEEDMAAVLLDYHQVYECSLQARAFTLSSDVAAGMSAEGELFVSVTKYWSVLEQERKAIDDELVISRGALRRALQYVSGRGRLHPLENALVCFERATLDIRNSLSLAAEASACLPRIWDARTSLRTLPQDQ